MMSARHSHAPTPIYNNFASVESSMLLSTLPKVLSKRIATTCRSRSGVLITRSVPESKSKVHNSRSSYTRSCSKTMADNPTKTVSYVTISDENEARKLARLAACVNIVKEINSIYEWQGEIEENSESMLIIKSDSTKTIEMTQFVESNHPYDCPEVVTVKIDSGSKKYLDWIGETISKPRVTKSS